MNLRGLVFATLLLPSLALAQTPDDVAPDTVEPSFTGEPVARAQLFSSWNLRLWEGGDFNAFEVDRAELGGGWQWPEFGGFFVNLEGVRSAGPDSLQGVDGDSIVMRIKHAFAFGTPEVGPGRVLIHAGLIPDPWIASLDSSFDLRGQFPTTSEATGLFDTSDFGLSVGYELLDGLVTARVWATNGEGRNDIELNAGKNTAAVVSTSPFRFDVWGSQVRPSLHVGARDGSAGVGSTRNHRFFGAITLTHRRLDAGFELAHALGHNGNGALEGRALGAWLRIEPIARWVGIFGRFQHFDPQVDAADDQVTTIGGGLYSDLIHDGGWPGNRIRIFTAFEANLVDALAAGVPGVPDSTSFNSLRIGIDASAAFGSSPLP